VAQGQATRTGGSQDDFHEDTDIVRTQNERSKNWEGTRITRDLGDDEVEIGESVQPEVIEEGIPVTEWVDRVLPDGRIQKVQVTRTIRVTKSTTIKTVRKFTTSSTNVDSIKPVIVAFTDIYGQELTEDQLTLFNYIAATDNQGAYDFKYNYVQVRQEHLRKTLNAITDIFYAVPSQADLDNFEVLIRTCANNEPVVVNVNTDAGESYTAEGWTVRVDALFSTCANNKPGVQLATWSSTKTGGWAAPDRFTQPNSESVDKIITQWLFRALHLLFTCTDADLPIRPTNCSDPENAGEISSYGRRRL